MKKVSKFSILFWKTLSYCSYHDFLPYSISHYLQAISSCAYFRDIEGKLCQKSYHFIFGLLLFIYWFIYFNQPGANIIFNRYIYNDVTVDASSFLRQESIMHQAIWKSQWNISWDLQVVLTSSFGQRYFIKKSSVAPIN